MSVRGIGRTNTLQAVTRDVAGLAMDMRQGERADRRLAVDESTANLELKKYQQEEANKTQPIPISRFSNMFPDAPSVKAMYQEYADANGYIKQQDGMPEPYMERQHSKATFDYFTKPEQVKKQNAMALGDYKNTINQIDQNIQKWQTENEGKDGSKDKTMMSLQQEKARLSTKYNQVYGAQAIHTKAMDIMKEYPTVEYKAAAEFAITGNDKLLPERIKEAPDRDLQVVGGQIVDKEAATATDIKNIDDNGGASGDSFTLSPGQTRFSSKGGEIASVSESAGSKDNTNLTEVELFNKDPEAFKKYYEIKKGKEWGEPQEISVGDKVIGIGQTKADGSIKMLSTKRKLTKSEVADNKRIEAIEKIEKLDPNEAYRRGYQIEDDGTLFKDLATGAPKKLPSFHEVMSKRGGVKALKIAGEFWDDAKQLQELLNEPEVKTVLKMANEDGLWDRATGKWTNTFKNWLQSHGYAPNSKVYTAMARIQRMASQERKTFLGTAVTGTELKSILGWMPSAGDSYSTMVTKTNLARQEGEEVFKRYLDVYKNEANMSPWYSAFGLKRFESQDEIKTRLTKKYRLDE